MSKHVQCWVDICCRHSTRTLFHWIGTSPALMFIATEKVFGRCSLCVCTLPYWFDPLIRIQVTLSPGTPPHTSLYFNESHAMSGYVSPHSHVMTITFLPKATPITVMPSLQNCPKTWDQRRDSHHLGFIGLDSVIDRAGIFNFMHLQHLSPAVIGFLVLHSQWFWFKFGLLAFYVYSFKYIWSISKYHSICPKMSWHPGVLHLSPRRVTHVLVRLTGSRRLPSLAVIETSQKCGQGCVLSVSLLLGSWGSVVGERTCLMSALTRVLPLRGSCSKGRGQKQLWDIFCIKFHHISGDETASNVIAV